MTKQNLIVTIALGAALFLLSVAPSYSATVTVGDSLVFSAAANRLSWAGGAFHIKDTTSGFEWDTFCLEYNEYINFGGTFSVSSVGPSAIAGGFGNASPPLLPGGPTFSINSSGSGSDPISSQTAYLYFKYATGGISGFTGSGLEQQALQNVFWYLENEITALDSGNPLQMQYYDLARNNAVDGQFYGVAVVNPTYLNGTLAQSQLVYVPVPEPGTMVLLGSGLVGLAGWGRKKYRK
jgi:hypothetical protein